MLPIKTEEEREDENESILHQEMNTSITPEEEETVMSPYVL